MFVDIDNIGAGSMVVQLGSQPGWEISRPVGLNVTFGRLNVSALDGTYRTEKLLVRAQRTLARAVRAESQPTRHLPQRILDSDAGQFAIEWLETPEEDASSRVIRSADCYAQYEDECAAWGCEALSARRFAMLAMGYVDAFTGKGGVRWYRFLNVTDGPNTSPNVRDLELNVRNAA